MRISDWSSDVCSSDLLLQGFRPQGLRLPGRLRGGHAAPAPPGVGGLERRPPWLMSVRVDFGAVPAFHRRVMSTAFPFGIAIRIPDPARSEEHTSELQSLMRTSYAVFCLKKKPTQKK